MANLARRRFIQSSMVVGSSGSALLGCSDPEVAIDASSPTSEFGAESTAELVTEGLDLSGLNILVTGANSGLGYETMRVLSLRGAHVIGTARTREKAEKTCISFDADTSPAVLELSDFQSAVDCAEYVRSTVDELHVVICNAGINTFGDLELVDGIEKIFRVNHLGHFVLINHLLPLLKNTPNSRIVHVGSRSAYKQAPAAGIDFDNLRGEGVWDAGQAYGRSKLANALFSLELSKRLRANDVSSNVVHPGLVKTNIARTAPVVMRTAFNILGGLIAKTPAEGAATQCYVATHPTVAGVTGKYFADCNPMKILQPNHLFNEQMAAQLWQESLRMTNGFV